MLFLFTVLNVVYVLDPNLQLVEDPAPNANPKEIMKVAELKKKREENNFICRGHIFNTLSNRLYDLYMLMQSPVETRKALEENTTLSDKGCNLGLNRRKSKQLGQIEERSKEGGPKQNFSKIN